MKGAAAALTELKTCMDAACSELPSTPAMLASAQWSSTAQSHPLPALEAFFHLTGLLENAPMDPRLQTESALIGSAHDFAVQGSNGDLLQTQREDLNQRAMTVLARLDEGFSRRTEYDSVSLAPGATLQLAWPSGSPLQTISLSIPTISSLTPVDLKQLSFATPTEALNMIDATNRRWAQSVYALNDWEPAHQQLFRALALHSVPLLTTVTNHHPASKAAVPLITHPGTWNIHTAWDGPHATLNNWRLGAPIDPTDVYEFNAWGQPHLKALAAHPTMNTSGLRYYASALIALAMQSTDPNTTPIGRGYQHTEFAQLVAEITRIAGESIYDTFRALTAGESHSISVETKSGTWETRTFNAIGASAADLGIAGLSIDTVEHAQAALPILQAVPAKLDAIEANSQAFLDEVHALKNLVGDGYYFVPWGD